MRDDKVYLEHILESIDYIASFVTVGKAEFFNSRLIQDAVIRNLEIIGEAVKNLSSTIRAQHQDIPWREMAGLRDILIHEYFGVDLHTVWGVVEKELPRLKPAIQAILEQ
jgi:uncharacterized protein with HEPN domain